MYGVYIIYTVLAKSRDRLLPSAEGQAKQHIVLRPHPQAWQKRRVDQNHTFVVIYGVYTGFLAGKLPYIRSYTVCIYSYGQP
jgi:hypothetical protein